MAKILIAEDDEKIAQLEVDYLESNGYETALVTDGWQVIPELNRNSYDLLLLDLMLPGCSGYDICRTIRGRHSHPDGDSPGRGDGRNPRPGAGSGRLYHQTL